MTGNCKNVFDSKTKQKKVKINNWEQQRQCYSLPLSKNDNYIKFSLQEKVQYETSNVAACL